MIAVSKYLTRLSLSPKPERNTDSLPVGLSSSFLAISSVMNELCEPSSNSMFA